MSDILRLATHRAADAYWSGGEYELNLSFGTLRDKQWQPLVPAVWDHEALNGPVGGRYVPGEPVEAVPVEVPGPTATRIQYGVLGIDDLRVGCCVLATRSLFECVTVQVPLGMFDGIRAEGEAPGSVPPRLAPLDRIYQDLALAVYDVVPFEIANIGFQCECRLVAELQVDTEQRLELLATGHFFAQDAVLTAMDVWPDDFPAVRPGLRWVSSHR